MGSLARSNTARGMVAFVVALAIVAGFFFIFASPGAAPASTRAGAAINPTATSTLTVIHETGSYVVGYATLRDLRDASDLVVVGTVGQSSAATAPGGPDPNIQSEFSVTVERVVAAKPEANAQGGATLEPGASIDVSQIGGIAGRTELINDDDPLMRQGDHVILFLRQMGPGAYIILEPQGHFVIDAQGIVHPCGLASMFRGANAVPLAQFLQLLVAA